MEAPDDVAAAVVAVVAIAVAVAVAIAAAVAVASAAAGGPVAEATAAGAKRLKRRCFRAPPRLDSRAVAEALRLG